ncbi:hypothetical protein jhhlp_006671 [Lomentospora prolificans]|uniref:Uncharacterized protein n=1 Tax=Lomentospora prolificans TaxID=41688 RepID=A0A2N3N6I9_9PEZI|nr:hypothetical protein jhhlp_006671 [Lomentospora prolificans]
MALTLTVIFPAFNAALVIYSGLLIKAYADSQDDVFSLGNINIDRRLLLQAVETLATLDNGNVRAEKCARYIMKLDRVLDALYSTTDVESDGASLSTHKSTRQAANTSAATIDAMADLFSQEQTPIGLDMTDLMVPGDLDFLKYFDPNMHLA